MCDAFLQGFVRHLGPKIPDFYAQKIRCVDTNIYQKCENVENMTECTEIEIKPEIRIGKASSLNNSDGKSKSKKPYYNRNRFARFGKTKKH